MNLTQAIASVGLKSYFSRTREEVIEALNSASRRLYHWVLKEQKNWFLKWDLSLTFTNAAAEYQLQPDLERIVRVREQDPASGNWRIMHSTDINDVSRLQSLFPSLFFGGGTGNSTDSPYRYYGPYEKDDGKYYITIEPPADVGRKLEIVYNAQYVEVTAESEFWMLPDELRDAGKDGAIAECLRSNNDMLYKDYEASHQAKRNEYLPILRAKQLSDPPKVIPYLADMDVSGDEWPVIPGSP